MYPWSREMIFEHFFLSNFQTEFLILDHCAWAGHDSFIFKSFVFASDTCIGVVVAFGLQGLDWITVKVMIFAIRIAIQIASFAENLVRQFVSCGKKCLFSFNKIGFLNFICSLDWIAIRIAIQIASFAKNLVGQFVGCGKNVYFHITRIIFSFICNLDWITVKVMS